MNWAPEALQAEIDYRVERAIGDAGTTREHLRSAREAHPSWWRRHLTNHLTHHDERDGVRAA